jgi:hypothetical protein
MYAPLDTVYFTGKVRSKLTSVLRRTIQTGYTAFGDKNRHSL